MQVLTNPRFLTSLAALVGVVVSLLYPGSPEEKIVSITASALTFLAGLFQPTPGQPTKDAAPAPVGRGGK